MGRQLSLWLLVGGFALVASRGNADQPLPGMTERRIIGHDDLEPIENTRGTAAYDMSRVVARVEAGDGLGYCTATRVGVDLFLTNFHCAELRACDDSRFRLGYEKALAADQQLLYRCKAVLAKSVTFDYALYQGEYLGNGATVGQAGGQAGQQDAGGGLTPSDYPVAVLYAGPLTVGQLLLAPGHPSGRPKEIDRGSDCKLLTVAVQVIDDRQTLTHSCDTEGGSSGTPLLDRATGRLVALHWGGEDGYNMAVPVSKIVDDLKANVAAEIYGALTIER